MSEERIVRLAARGDGVSESGAFFPFTAPGDRVEADGRVTPGPHRTEPPCRHFPECGGCQLQHVDDEAYRFFLADRIETALAAQRVAAGEMRAAHLSPPNSRRRAAFRAERMGRDVRLGFNAQASHRIVDMRECHVLRPELFALVAPLRDWLRGRLAPRRRAEARMTLCDQGIELLVTGIRVEGYEALQGASDFAGAQRLARLAVDDGDGPLALWEPEPATITLSGVPVALPHGAFLQATGDGETALVEAVREAVGGAATVADLFAGIGTFALAQKGRVVAVEGARDAAAALQAAAARAGRLLRVEHRDLFRRPLEADELDFDAVILDPPRAGAQEQVGRIARSTVPVVAYVSCNPPTFARDAAILAEGGFRLDWVRPVGQFRWSTHVELAARFSR